MEITHLPIYSFTHLPINSSTHLLAYKTIFCSFFALFCTFCASLRLKRTVFTRLLKKAISMALWTKVILCVKSSLLEQSLPRTPSRPIRSLPTYQVGPRNPCNPRLINDLRLRKITYEIIRKICKTKPNSKKVK